MTPLDSSHLEVFLEFFWKFFIFLNLNLNFKFGPVSYRTKPEPVRSGLTGNRSNRTGYRRFGEPCLRQQHRRRVAGGLGRPGARPERRHGGHLLV